MAKPKHIFKTKALGRHMQGTFAQEGAGPCDHPIIQFSYQRRCVSMFDRLHARDPGIIPSFERAA
jgi:hypothetical protein